MLRVGVIGMGHIGNRHAEICKNDDPADLVGVRDITSVWSPAAIGRAGGSNPESSDGA